MHLGLNLLFLVPGETGGMEVAARKLTEALVTARPDLRITAFVNRETADSKDALFGDLVPAVTVPIRARRRPEWVWGEQALLPRLAARERVDLLHSLGNTAPARGRFRRVVTVHDLIYRFFPETHFGLRALGMRLLVPLAAKTSHRVIADSAQTRDDLVRLLGVGPAQIDVVPLGVEPAPQAGWTDEPELRSKLGLGSGRFVLSVSAKRPHKNLARLIEALALIPGSTRPLLVLPGYSTPYEQELKALADRLRVGESVKFFGWLPQADLEGLYRAAACFIFPSLYEGFGLPVLEAMARGLPVACSSRASLAEVAGDVALQFDPESPKAVAGALLRLLEGGEEIERLKELGLRRAGQFTWDGSAQSLLQTYEQALAG